MSFAVNPAFIRTPAAVIMPGMVISFTPDGSLKSVHGPVASATKFSDTEMQVTVVTSPYPYADQAYTISPKMLIVLHLDTMVDNYAQACDDQPLGASSAY